MKFLIASDIHGSEKYTEELLARFGEEGADQLVLLGDIYNHGPRNPLPDGYDPLGVARLLNAVAGRLTVIKGNCDSDVDTMISDFEFVSEAVLTDGGKKIFLQHGDRFNIDALPKNCGDAFFYGHYHTGFIERKGGETLYHATLNTDEEYSSAQLQEIMKNNPFIKSIERCEEG